MTEDVFGEYEPQEGEIETEHGGIEVSENHPGENMGTYLFDFVIFPEHRGQGHGRRLLERVIKEYGDRDDLTLHVYSNNTIALRLYESLGFVTELRTEYPGRWLLFMRRPCPVLVGV